MGILPGLQCLQVVFEAYAACLEILSTGFSPLRWPVQSLGLEPLDDRCEECIEAGARDCFTIHNQIVI
jgi:hypothetical protein